MFEFLFRKRKQPEATPETQRARFERLILELNEVIETLPEKPAVTIQPTTGRISFTMPAQFMDEALALPKPEPVAKSQVDTPTEAAQGKAKAAAIEAAKAGDPVAAPGPVSGAKSEGDSKAEQPAA